MEDAKESLAVCSAKRGRSAYAVPRFLRPSSSRHHKAHTYAIPVVSSPEDSQDDDIRVIVHRNCAVGAKLDHIGDVQTKVKHEHVFRQCVLPVFKIIRLPARKDAERCHVYGNGQDPRHRVEHTTLQAQAVTDE